MKPLIIIKTGSTFPALVPRPGDFEDWIIEGMGLFADRCQVVSVYSGESLPSPNALSGVVITGSHDMVTDAHPWSEEVTRWLPGAVEHHLPILGICYGHQLLAHALGGQAGFHPRGREIGTIQLHATRHAGSDLLFGELPSEFSAHVTHAQSVLRLPPNARLLAASDFEPHHAFALGDLTWGVQFHPEFDEKVTRHYILEQRETLRAEGRDIALLLKTVRPSPIGDQLLQRFAQIVTECGPK